MIVISQAYEHMWRICCWSTIVRQPAPFSQAAQSSEPRLAWGRHEAGAPLCPPHVGLPRGIAIIMKTSTRELDMIRRDVSWAALRR